MRNPLTEQTGTLIPQAGDPPGATDGADGTERVRAVARLVLVSLALVVLAFRQAPGRTLPDTKLDLVADPSGWLLSAAHLWDPGNAFGQLQNQAYGYLFPMGPFFWLGDVAGMPEWVVQRLWWSLLTVVAFLGLVKVAERLGAGSPWTRIAAGVLYALSPRIQAELGTISVESWPVALAPWVLLPLLRPRSPWRAATASGLVVLCLGGVNAVASGAALVPAGLWLVTRRPTRQALGLLGRWLLCVVLATAWWVGPLLLLGRYSPPFLDWIEDATVTTRGASLYEGLRGTSHWLPYLADGGGPVWPTGWNLLSQPVLVLNTTLVVVLAVVGLAHRRAPERGYLVTLVLVGLALLTLGHVGPGGAWYAESAREALDGVLSAARNTHKFDVVVRLGLCLALAHGATRVRVPGAPAQLVRPVAVVATVGVAAVVAGATAPALGGDLAPRGSYEEIPGYWRETAQWLDAQPAPGRALVVPGASSAAFTWGTTAEEPLQPLMDRPMAVRDIVPLGAAGSRRLIDSWQVALESGRGSPGLREVLARSGVGFVVLRADLAASTDAPVPLSLRQALVDSGLQPVAAFGPLTGSTLEGADQTVQDRLLQPQQAVEVWAVGDVAEPFELLALAGSLRASGGPEDLVSLAESGLLTDRAAFLGDDGAQVPDPTPVSVLTDGLRKRETAFGRSRDNASPTLTADDEGSQGRAVREAVEDDAPHLATTAEAVGFAGVRTSSSAADAGATRRTGPGDSGWAALDGAPGTRWVSGTYARVEGEWIEVRLDAPVDPGTIRLGLERTQPGAARVTEVRVETDAGVLVSTLEPRDGIQQVPVPAGRTERIRVVAHRATGGVPAGVAVTTLEVPGVETGRTLRMPAEPARGPLSPVPAVTDAILLRAGAPGRDACMLLGQRPLCSPSLQRAGEEDAGLDRTFELSATGAYSLTGTVRTVPGPALDRLLDGAGAITASASSTWVDAVAARPGAAVDRDLGTGWVAAEDDDAPTLTLVLPEEREVEGLQVMRDAALAASRPTRLLVAAGGEPVEVTVDEEGYVELPPTATTRVEVTVLEWDAMTSFERGTGYASELPPGVSELRVLGADDLRRALDPEASVAVQCGFGPDVELDGRRLRTEVVGSVADVLADRPLTWRRCDASSRALEVEAGEHRLVALASAEFRPDTLLLSRDVPVLPPAPRPDVEEVRTSPTHALLDVPPRGERTVLTMPQNHNAGWRAEADGEPLAAVRVDGWRQGFLLPAGDAVRVEVVYGPQRAFLVFLGVGGLAALALVATAVVARRRAGTVHRHRAPGAAGDLGRGLPLPAAAPRVAVLAGLAFVAVVGGPVGAVAAGAAVVLTSLIRLGLLVRGGHTGVERVQTVLAAAAVLAAGVLAAAATWPGGAAGRDSAVVQLLVALALALVVVSGADRRREPQRITGRSTQR
ncbi:alpha-(1-_3)-arabinofuranosyltransferase domain-containing protein [Thalassiella azotivora]